MARVDLPAGTAFSLPDIARNQSEHNQTEPVGASTFAVPSADRAGDHQLRVRQMLE
ncbi:MAG: hypothetical protein ABI332_16460 [Polyangiaceae bacterium]